MSKTKIVALVVVIMLLLCTALGVVCYYSEGFKNWDRFCISNSQNHPQPPVEKLPIEQQPTESNKQIVNTIVETEKYGTFTLPQHYIKTRYTDGIVFNSEQTIKLDYVIAEFMENLGVEPGSPDFEYNFQYSKVVISFDMYIESFSSSFNTTYIENSASKFRKKLYEVNNNEYFYSGSVPVFELLERSSDTFLYSFQLYILFDNGTDSGLNFLDVDMFVENVEHKDISYMRVISSDTGVPLTEGIYNEIMSDSATKITYVYEK